MPSSMCVLMRARYAEDALERALEPGVRKYVILGAGMDSFAFRRPDLMRRSQADEVDHPVTQSAKLRRIKRAGPSRRPPRGPPGAVASFPQPGRRDPNR